MKKIVLTLAVVISCTGLKGMCAQGYIFTPKNVKTGPVYTESLQLKNVPNGKYLKYYNFNPAEINAEFINLSSTEEKNFLKTLSKEEQENYKYVKKIQKLIQKGEWNKVFEKYPNYLPAYLQCYNLNYKKGDYNEAIRLLNKIWTMDKRGQIVNSKLVNQSFGMLYFATAQYTKSLNYFMMYENTNDDFVTSYIAHCYFALGNYSKTIEYCKKLNNLEYQDKELLYLAYFNINNYTEANKLAKQLLNEDYNYDNLMRIQQTINNDELKLSYAYKARAIAQDDSQIYEANTVIADLEQAKLDKAGTKYTQFIKIPKWQEFEKPLAQIIPAAEITQKQDEFFKNANLYLKKYSGQQLTNAFNSLNQDFTNYVQDKKNEYYQQQQLEAQKALVIEQQRNNILQQEMIREQQIRNYLERQHYYYYMRPRYYW